MSVKVRAHSLEGPRNRGHREQQLGLVPAQSLDPLVQPGPGELLAGRASDEENQAVPREAAGEFSQRRWVHPEEAPHITCQPSVGDGPLQGNPVAPDPLHRLRERVLFLGKKSG